MNKSKGPMGRARGGVERGRCEWIGQGKVVVGKWRQLYSNISFIKVK